MDLRDQLQEALKTAYSVERELGGGGMSRVFVAQEKSLKRSVVIKVLPPELANAVSGERFQREIQLAAQLQHPHIVPVLSAGDAGELTYYTMPYVVGESLRDRLSRGGELPVGDAVRALRDIAAALAYAHKHNVVHRDIKPDNVLLSDGYAVVTDFGVAKAISSSATGEGRGITSLGVALGTPAYMSPEQAAAEPNIDHRSDIYSLGVLAYELLSGTTPFAGRAMAAQLAAQINDEPESLARRRPNVPPVLVDMVMNCLAKRAADRPQSAEELVRTLDTLNATPTQSVSAGRRAGVRRQTWIGGALVLAAIGGAIWVGAPDLPVDSRLIAVFPFRVTSPSAGLDYLKEGGLPDLMSIKLATGAGFRASDVSAVLTAWKKAGGGDIPQRRLSRLAAGLGAGQYIAGEVVGTPGNVIVRATLRQTRGGTDVDASVEGAADSIASLVDQLTAQLLARQAGESGERLTLLTRTPLPVLRAYLEGRAWYRAGNYSSARRAFVTALRIDSGFMPALVGGAKAYSWNGTVGVRDSLYAAAWRQRDKLSRLDRMYVEAAAGRRNPGHTPYAERIAAAEAYAVAAAETADGWAMFADYMYHFGNLAGIPDALVRSRAAFERAFAIDSNFAPVLDHLPTLYHELGDTAARDRAVNLLLQRDSSDRLAQVQWLAAAFRNDSTGMHAAPDRAVGGAMAAAMTDGLGALDVDRRVRAFNYEGLAGATRRQAYASGQRPWAANLGRTRELMKLHERFAGDSLAMDLRTMDALFWDADVGAGARGALALTKRTGTGRTAATLVRRVSELAAVAIWSFDHGPASMLPPVERELRAIAAMPDTLTAQQGARLTLLAIDAIRATRAKSADALTLVARLDSGARSGATSQSLYGAMNLVSSRLWEQAGNLPNALAAVRRKDYHFSASPVFHTTYLREEGRLAEATGDREGAIKAYTTFLALRFNPDPELKPEVERIRAKLDALKRLSSGQ